MVANWKAQQITEFEELDKGHRSIGDIFSGFEEVEEDWGLGVGLGLDLKGIWNGDLEWGSGKGNLALGWIPFF